MQRIEHFHSFNRASPLIKYPRSNLLSSNARRGETFLRFNYKTHPVFHREIIIFVSIRGEKRAIGDINSGEENAVAEPRFGFRIGTKDRLFEFRKEWGKARIILRRIPPDVILSAVEKKLLPCSSNSLSSGLSGRLDLSTRSSPPLTVHHGGNNAFESSRWLSRGTAAPPTAIRFSAIISSRRGISRWFVGHWNQLSGWIVHWFSVNGFSFSGVISSGYKFLLQHFQQVFPKGK